MPARRRASTTARGLGSTHQRARARLLAAHLDGTPCPCTDCGPACPCRRAGLPPGHGLPMHRDPTLNVDGMTLEADHGELARSLGGVLPDRLLLATCNRSRGNGTRGARTHEVQPRWSRQW